MKKIVTYLPIIAVTLMILFPATKPFLSGQFFHMHDFTHAARLAEMDRALEDGHFPVRWSRNFGFGYGMPLFNFYGPLPFYIAEIFHAMGFTYINAIKLLFLLTFVLGFIAMYRLTKKYFGVLGALVAATAFIYAPYRAVDVYVRGSVNELFGITFTALSLMAIDAYIENRSLKWFVAGAMFLAGIVTSHNISSLFAYPAIGFVALVLAWLDNKKTFGKNMIGIISMFLLGIGLSASYSLPAFVEKSYASLNTITSGYFHYSQHFLYLRQFLNSPFGYGGSVYGLEDGLSFEIGKIHWLLVGLGLLATVISRKLTFKARCLVWVSWGIMGGSMLMATFKSQFLWDNSSLLQYIQFPWRFLSLIIIFASIIAAAAITAFEKVRLSKISLALIGIIAVILYNQSLFRPEKYLSNAEDLHSSSPQRIQEYMSSILPDYIPPGVSKETQPPQGRFELIGEVNEVLTPTISRTDEFLVEVPVRPNTLFRANIFAFPGWKLFIDEKEVIPQIGSDIPTLNLDLNKQNLHTNRVYISGYLADTPIRVIGNYTTLVSMGIAIGMWVKTKETKNEKRI